MRGALAMGAFVIYAAMALHPAIAEEEEIPHGERDFRRNHLALILGATTGEDETGFTVGADYEFRPLDNLGFGILVEAVVPPIGSRDWVVLLPIISHPNRDAEGGWELIIGPGLEKDEYATDFLVRLGLSYGFPVEGWTLAPEFNGDLVHGEWSWVYGVSIGRGF